MDILGGGMYIHLFGAIYGIVISKRVYKSEQNDNINFASSYITDIIRYKFKKFEIGILISSQHYWKYVFDYYSALLLWFFQYAASK